MLVEKRLVDYCFIAPDEVRVSIGGTVLSFTAEDARSFLALLLTGWRGTPASIQTYLSAASTRSSPPFATKSHTSDLPEGDGSSAVEGDEPPWPVGYANYLDIVLAMAEEMDLIVGFTKHPQRDAITILTKATKVEMSFIDAFEYLSSIVVQELRRRVRS